MLNGFLLDIVRMTEGALAVRNSIKLRLEIEMSKVGATLRREVIQLFSNWMGACYLLYCAESRPLAHSGNIDPRRRRCSLEQRPVPTNKRTNERDTGAPPRTIWMDRPFPASSIVLTVPIHRQYVNSFLFRHGSNPQTSGSERDKK